MINKKRNFVRIINEICVEENIALDSLSYDWIFRLSKENKANFIMGYQFGLNLAVSNEICCDKSAASEMMELSGIPNIKHELFMSMKKQKYIGTISIWNDLIDRLNKYGKLVCKPNNGTGGDEVYLVTNQAELENATNIIFTHSDAMAVSPYVEITDEYRCVVLDGEIELIYKKKRPSIIGDGISTVNEIILKSGHTKVTSVSANKVLANGEEYFLSWKHNLGLGASSEIVLVESCNSMIIDLAKQVSLKLNIRFASIDIVLVGNEYKVLEVNSGVMLEFFSRESEENYQIAKCIYRDAIVKMLE